MSKELTELEQRCLDSLRRVEMVMLRFKHRLDLVTENERQMILKPLLEHDGREYNRFYQLGIRDER